MSRLAQRKLHIAVLTTAIGATCATVAAAMPRFSDWSAPINAETLSGSSANVNTPAVDGCVSLSHDGRELYFNSSRDGNQDIYVATRDGPGGGFSAPQRLPEPINTSADEFCPTVRQSGELYFSRASATDPGDLFVSREGPSGWRNPTRLGSEINSPLMEETPTFYEDDRGKQVMIFSRRQANGAGGVILMSIDGAAAIAVGGGAASAGSNNRPSVTHDGRTLFFDSTRAGTLGGPDLWMATRANTNEAFGPAIHLSSLSSPAFDARPTISWDGSELFFSSNRPGSESSFPDIWWTTRNKTPSGPKVIEF